MPPLSTNPPANALPAFYAYDDSTTRGAAEIMATEGVEALPVVERATGRICGELSIRGLLRGRERSIERENERLRLFGYDLD